MRSRFAPATFLSTFVLSALAACSATDRTAPSLPPALPPLAAAVWYVHTAEGQPLPALVAHSREQGALVQEFLDSAEVHVTSDGRWTRRLWLTRYRDGQVDARTPAQDVGTWMATDTAYVFMAEPSGERFSLSNLTPGATVRFPLRAIANGYIDATVRTVPPPVPLAGTYRMTAVRSVQLPAPIYVFNDHVEAGRTLSIHILVDSTRLALFSNRRYEQQIHYSEWEGPNNGPPTSLRRRSVHNDLGEWTRDGTSLRFESGWLQNHRFEGSSHGGGSLELLHGLSHGDVPVPVRYVRTN